jgi:hypothetical protein
VRRGKATCTCTPAPHSIQMDLWDRVASHQIPTCSPTSTTRPYASTRHEDIALTKRLPVLCCTNPHHETISTNSLARHSLLLRRRTYPHFLCPSYRSHCSHVSLERSPLVFQPRST